MIYGSLIQENYDELIFEQYNSIETYIFESDEIINNYLNEKNDLIIHPDIYTANDDEYNIKDDKKNKSLIENIKVLLDKLIITIKKLFNKLVEKIQNIYTSTNFVDKYMNNYKKIITEENYNTAKKNGWKGFEYDKCAIVKKYPTFDQEKDANSIFNIVGLWDKIQDTGANFAGNFKHIKSRGQEIINKILESKNDYELKKYKDEFVKFLNIKKLDLLLSKYDSETITKKITSFLKNDGSLIYYDTYDGKYYYPPNFSVLALTIDFATTGEEKLKKLIINNNKYLNSLKDSFKVIKKDYQLELNDKSTIYQKEAFKCTISLYNYLMKYMACKSKYTYIIYWMYWNDSCHTYMTLYRGIKNFAIKK